MKPFSQIMIGASLAALTSCTTVPQQPPIEQVADGCPVVKSDNWKAFITPVPGSQDRYQLTVTGNVVMPTPGYTFAWEQGRLDRSATPSFELRLLSNPPGGIVAQVLENREVTYAGPAAAAQYRLVTISCVGRVLGKIENVR